MANIGITDVLLALDPQWHVGKHSIVRQGRKGAFEFRELSDGTTSFSGNERTITTLRDGITVYETPSGLEIHHRNGVVVQIRDGILSLGDGRHFKSYGEVLRLYSQNRDLVYETMDWEGILQIVITPGGVTHQRRNEATRPLTSYQPAL